MSSTTDWIESNTKLPLTDDQKRCFDVLCSWCAPYNLPLVGEGWHGLSLTDESAPVFVRPQFVRVKMCGDFATYDFDNLTRLVLAAHAKAVRVNISADIHTEIDRDAWLQEYREGKDGWGFYDTDRHPEYETPCLAFMFHPKERDHDHAWGRHPTIEEAIARVQS